MSCYNETGPLPPYVAHLLAVTALVLEHGGTEAQAVAALLHDAIEDHPRGGRTREEKIRERFGEAVLAIVEACTDADSHPKPPWRERKDRYLAHLPELSAEARLVALADKVHNARAILADFRAVGDAVFQRFNAGKAETLWCYPSLADAFTKLDGGGLASELERTVAEIERLAQLRSTGASRRWSRSLLVVSAITSVVARFLMPQRSAGESPGAGAQHRVRCELTSTAACPPPDVLG